MRAHLHRLGNRYFIFIDVNLNKIWLDSFYDISSSFDLVVINVKFTLYSRGLLASRCNARKNIRIELVSFSK